jgi:hypothetical protein
LWMAFFSQFILPVNRFRDRQKIFDRLFRHLTRNHGPAIFIENGVIREHSQETLKKGPGVVWLDSASAAVTRTAVAIKKTIGPGVHFTDAFEYIEKSGTLDLHTQAQKLGPKDGDKPFDEKKEGQTAEQFNDIQKRRRQVSAHTRDGIELVPDISITFRVNTRFPDEDKPGSRFGYRTGTTPEAKMQEAEDKEVISRALLGEGINPYIDTESNLHRVAWNQLPAMIAVDVWREYASKFTLDEIINPSQDVSPIITKPLEPTYDEFAAMDNPSQAIAFARGNGGIMVKVLRNINNSIEATINTLEHRTITKSSSLAFVPPAKPNSPSTSSIVLKKTGLQIINEMLKARFTQSTVDLMDEYGKKLPEQIDSKEYEILRQRGLKVLSVSVSNVRLHPTIEESVIKQWKASWLGRAKGESEHLDHLRNLLETAALEKAQHTYAIRLSQAVDASYRKGTISIHGLLKALLLRSRAMIRSGEDSNSLRRRMITELQDIEDTIKWMEEEGT